MHLVIYFCGSGNSGSDFHKYYDDTKPDAKVKTIFVRGCEHKEVCNGLIFPNLKEFASRFVKKIFKKKDEATLNLTTTELLNLAVGIHPDPDKTTITDGDKDKEIESITLCGYSRGAVTCFEVAKQLNNLAPHIPVDIVADQPVPGNCYSGPGSNAHNVADCSNLQNLRNVTVILGTYTGNVTNYDPNVEPNPILSKLEKLYHRLFFSQIIPKLPRKAKRDLIVIPVEHHYKFQANSPSASHVHLNMQVSKYLYEKGLPSENEDPASKQVLIEKKYFEHSKAVAKDQYSAHTTLGYDDPAPYPPISELQGFFGIKKDILYKHKDKLHPNANITKGFEWTPGGDAPEKLMDWWNRHDKNNSFLSSDLTKKLKKTIASVNNIQDYEELKKIYNEADQWLIKKAHHASSRYHLVEALRNNIYYYLVNNRFQDKTQYLALNRKNLSEENYFANYWNEQSKALSLSKTDATRRLDKAFEVYSTTKNLDNFDAEKALIQDLDAWINEKKESNSTSKRFDLVTEIREHLQTIVDTLDLKQAPKP